SVLQLMVRVTKPFQCVKQALQELLALEERSFAKVVSIAVEKIKGKVNDGNLRDQVLAGGPHMHAFLQALEVAAALRVQRDNLSVKNRLAGGQSTGKGGHLGIALGDVNAVTRAQRQSAIFDSCQRAHAVPLDLKEPVRIGKRAVGECGQHGLHARRHWSLACALHLSRLNWDWLAFRWQLLLNLFYRASGKRGTVVLVDVP